MTILLGAAGFVLLFAGGELTVRGAVTVARRLRLPPLLVGIVVVGFATSTPELVVSIRAALAGNPNISLGSVVGSDIANILLILAIAALVCPVCPKPMEASREALVMTASLAVLAALALTGTIARWQGVVLLGGLAVYVAASYRADVRRRSAVTLLHEHEADDIPTLPRPAWVVAAGLLAGLASLILGASWLVAAATAAARSLGVSEAVIGVTIVALGTSLPELAAALSAARHGHGDIVVGNILGSNIFNALGIVGITAVVRPLAVESTLAVDAILAAAISAVLVVFFLRGWRIGRATATLMIVAYVAYVAVRFIA